MRNRALIIALDNGDFQAALTLVNAGADPNTRKAPTPAPTLPQWLKHLLHHTPPPANDSLTAPMLGCYVDVKTRESDSGTVDAAETKLALASGDALSRRKRQCQGRQFTEQC